MHVILLLLFLAFSPYASAQVPAHLKCVQFFYDHPAQNNNKKYLKGRMYVIGLQNLLGHFPAIQQYIYPVETYQAGQFDRCEANIYIGSYFNNNLPDVFIRDFVTTKQNVAWLGYNIEQLGSQALTDLWSVSLVSYQTTNWNKLDANGRPGIYNDYLYKGETFERCSYPYPPKSPEFINHYTHDYDIALLKPLNASANKYVVAWGQFTLDKKKTPYIIRNKNHWYVADNPFSFICDGDRYFIFADVLFDILNEPPQNGGKKFAFVRYEDVSPRQRLTNITTIADIFHKLQVPYTIAIIPIYTDPLHIYQFGSYIEIKDNPYFMEALKYSASKGASFIMHGVSHQHINSKNPFSGVTAEDFEFWDKNNERPIKEDSVAYILNRLTYGYTLLANAHIKVNGWMTAHYSASPLDNVILGQVFTWDVGRGNYFVSKVKNLQPLLDQLTFDQAGVSTEINAKRLSFLKDLKVETLDPDSQLNQIFPYEIYGDYYGRRIIPEDMGNLQPFINNQVITTHSVADILRDAKRYRVLRDVWASYFIHDLMLNLQSEHGLAKTEGDTSQISYLIQTIKDYGYEYIDLKEWVKLHTKAKRLEPVEPYPP